MMKIIIDSGGTKAHWHISQNGTEADYFTSGLNPYYATEAQMQAIIETELFPQYSAAKNATEIYFYGAGCNAEANMKTVLMVLENIFEMADTVMVQHDMLGTARALCGYEAGIACILGTGSNSCFYDGTDIELQPHSLGYVFGDEGSGAFMGKRLLADYFNKKIPIAVVQKFESAYYPNLDEVLNNIYKQPAPNKYLAGFAPFLSQNITDAYCYDLVYNAFDAFFNTNIVQYHTIKRCPLHFTGSVAFNFKEVLIKVANTHQYTIGQILKSPMEGLVRYHS